MAATSKIIRTPTRVAGGITADERARLDDHARLWIKRAFRTDPIEPDKIIPAIEGIYAAAGLKRPRVVIAPSPLVMAFAYGAASAIWAGRAVDAPARAATDKATRDAAYDAVSGATDLTVNDAVSAATDATTYAVTSGATAGVVTSAVDEATHAAASWATFGAISGATREAGGRATDVAADGAARACYDLAGQDGLNRARRWFTAYQGGNMWPGSECYLTAMRDVLGLRLPEYEAYAPWEQAAIHGGFRVMHKEFCIVSDFPEFIRVDDANRPHCENGPSHRWRDGWSLYHWHGVRVPPHWIEQRATLDPNEVIAAENVEQRAAGAAIVGLPRMESVLKAKVIDDSGNDDIGQLIELTLPGLPEPGRFLKAVCPRNGTIIEGVPRVSDIDGLPIDTAIAAQAWRIGDPQAEYIHPPVRT